jgi:hypothetical protein
MAKKAQNTTKKRTESEPFESVMCTQAFGEKKKEKKMT